MRWSIVALAPLAVSVAGKLGMTGVEGRYENAYFISSFRG